MIKELLSENKTYSLLRFIALIGAVLSAIVILNGIVVCWKISASEGLSYIIAGFSGLGTAELFKALQKFAENKNETGN